MTNYARMYRFGFTPWERYGTVAAASISALLDRGETGRSRRLGRALDLGCGRGQAGEQDRAAVVQAAPTGLGAARGPGGGLGTAASDRQAAGVTC